MSAAEDLKRQLGEPKPKKATPRRTNGDTGESVFELANRVSTASILDRYGIEHDEKFAGCPGCSEPKALLCKDGGTKCLHARCSHAGPPGKPGFRSVVDIVAERERVEPLDAAKMICGWYGIELPTKTEQTSPPPDDFGPTDYDDAEPGPASAPRPSPSIEILDAEAIWAPLEPPVYVADGMARAGSLTELMAFGSSGKSWTAVELGVAVALGEPAFGRFATVKGPILYLDWEAGCYEMRRRFQAVSKGRGIVGPVAGVSLSSFPAMFMSRPDFADRLRPLCEGRSLVVLDTLKAASPGVDENDSSIREGLDALHRVAEKTGCAALVLTHSKKISGSLSQLDPREVGRGSGAIFDAADAVFYALYKKGEPLRIEQTKSRVGRSVEPFLVTIEDTDNEGVRVLGKDVPAENQGDEFNGLCNVVLGVVKGNPGCSVRLVRGLAGAKSTSVSAALEQLERHGAIRNDGKGQAAKWHAVPAAGKGRDEWEGDFDDR